MTRTATKLTLTALVLAVMAVAGLPSRAVQQEYDQGYRDYSNVPRADRYLAAEVWTNHADGEYYEGENIAINFRVNRDAFVAIYSIDTRGRVKLLFPSGPNEDNFVYGGATYSLPGPEDDYDLAVSGPAGIEHIQMITSRDRFPVPPWYRNSGIVFEGEDRYDYMDYLNRTHFVGYDGQKFAYDRAVVFVNEWEPYYYRPVYYPTYPAYSVYGNVYIDYPYGGSVYIDGYYWGVAPLYVPRLVVGWHTITIYDHYHHCWEHDFHVSHYNSVVFDKTVIKTSATITSKYASVREVGYRNPVNHGYPNFAKKSTRGGKTVVSGSSANKATRGGKSTVALKGASMEKKYARGSTKLVKTQRGYETTGGAVTYGGSKGKPSYEQYRKNRKSSGYYDKTRTYQGAKGYSGRSSGYDGRTSGKSSSSGYYQKKSGTSSRTYRGGSKSSNRGSYDPGSRSKSSKGSVHNRSSSSKSSRGSKSVSRSSKKSSSSKGSVRSSSKSSSSKSSRSKSSSSKGKSGGSSKSKKK